PELAAKVGVESDDIIVTTDVGQHQMWTAQFYPFEKTGTFLTSGSLGTMGFGLPAAIGAALANPDQRIVCISGDGSILMNSQELATLAENKLNVTVIVLQNGTLGMVRQQQEYLFNKNYSASIFSYVPDFVQIASGFGIDAFDADSNAEWYKRAFSSGPHLVKVDIAMGENVLPFVAAGKANTEPFRELLSN
ncbi:MAG: acetolactate synthase large subunit, partial [Treponema sp.]|nr:acetolactate synthase large subunit [Treponema sp.]